jgi:hypothetical protein
MRKFFVLVLLLSASAALAQNLAKEPIAAFPGDTIQVTTITALQTTDTIQVNLTAASEQCVVGPGGAPAQPPGTPPSCPNIGPISVEGPAQKSFSFSLPPNACVCLYNLTVTATAAPEAPTPQTPKPTPPSPRNIDISSPQYVRVNERPPTVTGLSRKAIYRDESGSWSLVFLGPPTLSKATGDYGLRFAGHALPLCAKDPRKVPPELIDPKDSEVSCFRSAASQQGQIAFDVGGKQFLSEFKGKQSVSLVRNGAESALQELYVVNASPTTPRNYALGITLALVVLIYVLLNASGKTMPAKSGNGSYLLTALFLDEETQTYSLSKCQFYAWTLAAVLGYVFFAVARSVVQGSPDFPDIPGNLPGILLFSAGTSVLATGITNTKGSKGAGQIHPTLADFITSGGVIAPERLQFVVWTVVGIFSFLTIVFQSDPLIVSTLPKIPEGFLQLMGISSAGYLGGKLARKAGPVIKGIKVDGITGTGDHTQLTLKVTGENLDPKAKIKLDGQPIRDSLFQFQPSGTPDPQTGFCTELTVVIQEAAGYVVNTHTLTVVNSDSQAADVGYPVDPMIVNPVTVAHATTLQRVEVTGDRFADPTYAQWKDAAGTVKDLPTGTGTPTAPAVVFNNPKSLSVWLVPGDKPGEGQLTLFSPLKLGVTAVVTVK